MGQLHEYPQNTELSSENKHFIETPEGTVNYITTEQLFGGLRLFGNSITRNLEYTIDGTSYTNYTTAAGLGNNACHDVFVSGSNIYVATTGGLSISTNGGSSYTNYTIANGLGNNLCSSVFVSGTNVYVANDGGLSISTNGGTSYTNYTTANGLGNNICYSVFVSGSNVYVATGGGVSISTNGGTSYTNYTTANGLGHNTCYGIFNSGSNVYVATVGGLSISTNGGTSYTNYTSSNGLGDTTCHSVYVSGSKVYVGTYGGLSISTNGGTSYTNYTTANGLGNNTCNSVFVSGSNVCVATSGGVSISSNGGTSYTNYTTAAGIGSNTCLGVFISSSNIYVGTTGGLSISSAVWKRINAGTGGVLEFDAADNAIDIYETTSGAAGSTATLTQLIQILIDRIKAYKPIYLNNQPTQWRADTHAGYGSTDTMIPYFTNIRVNNIVNSDISVVNNSTNGCKLTINNAGIYSIHFSMISSISGKGFLGLSLNSSQLTTPFTTINITDRLDIGWNAPVSGENGANSGHYTGWLAAGDIIRPHTNGHAPADAEYSHINVIKIA